MTGDAHGRTTQMNTNPRQRRHRTPVAAAARRTRQCRGPTTPATANEPAANLSLREQLEAARAERDANYDLYLRSQAELPKLPQTRTKEADEMRLYQSLPLARDLLPAFDNLHRARPPPKHPKVSTSCSRGCGSVLKQIEGALNRHQIVAIEAAGKPFDPESAPGRPANADPQTSSHDGPARRSSAGFTLQDRVVRPATVIVAQAPSDSESPSTTNKSASDKSKTSSTEEE